MTSKQPGYPLPIGELGGDDIVCQLVYLPNRDEYWQALLGAYHYMTTWRAWERDTGKRGRDAAADWRIAFEMTMECWRMTCLDEITERMDVIIDLLANQPGCCDTTTIGPIIITTTIIVPGEGDDPTHWGETEVEDWAEWMEYICYHAHRYVDILIEGARGLDVAVQMGSYTVEFLSLLAQLQRFTYKGYPINLAEIMEIYQGFKDAVDLVTEFDGLADRFETARDLIVCSFMQGSSLSDAVENAVDNEILWTLFYMWTDYASVQAMIYEGSFDGVGYLPALKRDDCETCPTIGLFEYIWTEPDRQGWAVYHGTTWEDGDHRFHPWATGAWLGNWNDETSEEIAERFEIGHPMVINRVEADAQFWAWNSPPEPERYEGFYFKVHTTAGEKVSPTYLRSTYGINNWFEVVWDIGEDVTLYRATGGCLQVFTKSSVLTPNQGVFLQNLKYAYV